MTSSVRLQAIESAVSDSRRSPRTAENFSTDVQRFVQTHGDEMEQIESGLRSERPSGFA